MKKIIFAVMAVAAIGFTSCGNKTQQGDAIDSVAIADSIADAEASNVINALSAAIDNKDAGKLQETIDAIKAKIAELVKQNPEIAKEYAAKVQEFVKENRDKITSAFAGNAAAAAAVNALTSDSAAESLTGAIDKLVSGADAVKEGAEAAAEQAKDAAAAAADKAVESAKDAAKDAANDAKEAVKDAAKEKASSAIDNAASSAKKSLGL